MKDNQKNILNIAVIMGARPNFIKAAPFFREARNHPDFNFKIVHTGQHFDENMSKIFFDQMEIPKPDIHLDIKGDFHTEKIGKMFNALKFELKDFDAVIVFGDVNSTLAGAIAAVNNNIKLIHIESGLRSHDRRMPEEIHRVIVDHLSHLLFTTEPSANENLAKEGVDLDRVKYVGNIMIESIEIFWDKIMTSDILPRLSLESKKYVLATIHRQENTDDANNLKNILEIINAINKFIPVVFPLHPGTRNKINNFGLAYLLEDLNIIDPLGYFDFINLIYNSKGVITDSGGIQEETTHLGIPCCTLRDNTERPITTQEGSNKLFPIDIKIIADIITHLEKNDFRKKHIDLWDDQVSKRIFRDLKDSLL